MNTITRKIKLIITDDVKNNYKQLYEWQEQVFRAANTAVTHMYFQRNMNEFFYLTNEAKIMFADLSKADPEKDKEALRVLTTSKQNSTYQVLSRHYKGKMPADIFSNLNAQLAATFSKESKEYFSGVRSLRTYKRNMPMPFSASSLRSIQQCDDRNYTMTLFGIPFKTYFGRDMSGNHILFDRAMMGEYKLCNSSIQLDGKKIYLLAVFQFESDRLNLDAEKVMYATLSAQFPIMLQVGNKNFYVGDKKEYLHRRYAIQGALRRQQIAARYNMGGQGRKKKTKNINRFEKSEKNYIATKQHQYTHKMIDACIKQDCGKLVLKFTPEPPEPEELNRQELKAWREENQLLLRNWGYHGLKEKISYKCKKVGILLEIEKEKASSPED